MIVLCSTEIVPEETNSSSMTQRLQIGVDPRNVGLEYSIREGILHRVALQLRLHLAKRPTDLRMRPAGSWRPRPRPHPPLEEARSIRCRGGDRLSCCEPHGRCHDPDASTESRTTPQPTGASPQAVQEHLGCLPADRQGRGLSRALPWCGANYAEGGPTNGCAGDWSFCFFRFTGVAYRFECALLSLQEGFRRPGRKDCPSFL